MITVPSNYAPILAGNHTVQYRIDLDGDSYYNEHIISGTLESGLYDEFTIGTAVSRILKFTTDLTEEFSTADLYFRLYQNENSYTMWLPKGKYFVATQEKTTNGLTTITCYDSMQKANAIYMTSGTWTTPYSSDLVSSIATRMGVTIDGPTNTYLTTNKFQITTGFVIGDNGTTMRSFLAYIGAVHCGGFIIDDYGNLKLWRYGEGYNETFYLIDNLNNAITFGGDRILV